MQRSKINKVSSEEEMYDCDYSNLEGKPFEPVPRDAFRPGIQIRNLKKSYYTNCFNRAVSIKIMEFLLKIIIDNCITIDNF